MLKKWLRTQRPELQSQYSPYQMCTTKHRECVNYPSENYSAENLCATNFINNFNTAKCRIFHILKSVVLN